MWRKTKREKKNPQFEFKKLAETEYIPTYRYTYVHRRLWCTVKIFTETPTTLPTYTRERKRDDTTEPIHFAFSFSCVNINESDKRYHRLTEHIKTECKKRKESKSKNYYTADWKEIIFFFQNLVFELNSRYFFVIHSSYNRFKHFVPSRIYIVGVFCDNPREKEREKKSENKKKNWIQNSKEQSKSIDSHK